MTTTIDHSGLGGAYLRAHPDTPDTHTDAEPCGWCARNGRPKPRSGYTRAERGHYTAGTLAGQAAERARILAAVEGLPVKPGGYWVEAMSETISRAAVIAIVKGGGE
jgi:hypothetical protein